MATRSNHHRPLPVPMLDADPDLAGGLAPGEFAAARAASVAQVVTLEVSEWDSTRLSTAADPGWLGLLVLDGHRRRLRAAAHLGRLVRAAHHAAGRVEHGVRAAHGSRRPTVTLALQRLDRAGLLKRESRHTWLLTTHATELLAHPESLAFVGDEDDDEDRVSQAGGIWRR